MRPVTFHHPHAQRRSVSLSLFTIARAHPHTVRRAFLAPLVSAVLMGLASAGGDGALAAADEPQPATLVRSIGSDTMGGLMRRWAAGLRVYAPKISLAVESRGSVTGPPALIRGESDLAPMSRQMNPLEITAFEKRYGYKPVFIRVALDALAVYVHKDNPIQGLTLQQVDGIFSSTRRCGGRAFERWGDLIFGSLSDTPIAVVGRNTISGTYDYFRDSALCGGEFRSGYVELEGSVAVVDTVGSSLGTIGFAGIGFRTSTVRALPLAKWESGAYVAYYSERHRDDPDLTKRYEPVTSGRYPLSRFLYVYVNKPPGKALPEAVEVALRYVLSERGQKDVADNGFVPLPQRMLRAERAKLAPGYQPSWWSGE